MKRKDDNFIAVLDLGTSKVLVLIAELLPDGGYEIVGIGSDPSRGMKKGNVVNIDATVQSIKRAVEEAELMAGQKVRSVYVNITGAHMQSFNSHGFVAIKDGEVTKEDIARVIEAANSVVIPAEQKILHVIPQDYTVDHNSGILDPVGMAGMRLEGRVHIISAALSSAQNIISCIRRCGIQVEDMVSAQVASAQSTLSADEKQLGACMIDIGGGTTDIAVYTDGAIRHTAVIPVAGEQVTNDLAIAFHLSHQDAEAKKLRHGFANKRLADKTQQELAAIIEPRFEELFALVLNELQRSGWDGLLSAGIVLTGGSAQMAGLQQLAEEIFQTHVRIAAPHKNPSYATAIGLLNYAQQRTTVVESSSKQRQNVALDIGASLIRVKNWFQGNF